MPISELARGSLDVVHDVLQGSGLEPEEIERRLGWAPGRYSSLFDEPGRVSLEEYSALLYLAEIEPLHTPSTPSPPERLPKAFGKRPLLRMATPGEAPESGEVDRKEMWLSMVFSLIARFLRLQRLNGAAIARILARALQPIFGSDDKPLQ